MFYDLDQLVSDLRSSDGPGQGTLTSTQMKEGSLAGLTSWPYMIYLIGMMCITECSNFYSFSKQPSLNQKGQEVWRT